ncbi:IS3 family insertion sequence transposase domain-containing protein (plasmid) [Sinorhizobium fredii]|uniref:IS3 family insertion sequence transposase domain-containing protein n=1 Tax=Rhizobium fredii TaxID=380 RepID=A0A2L0HBW4_RHIFR|nr:IS3 family insertion sequence transposase domain-containing protein [Sinorhizobium fredii]
MGWLSSESKGCRILHGRATTTEAVRRAIQLSQKSLRALSKRYGINQETVARELDRIIEERGKLGMIASDKGSELTSNAILQWTGRAKLDWHYIALGRERGSDVLPGLRVLNG